MKSDFLEEAKSLECVGRFSDDQLVSVGFLSMGYEKPYDAAEAFMRAAAKWTSPSLGIDLALNGHWRDVEDLTPKDLLCPRDGFERIDGALARIFAMCVERGFFFSGFLEICSKTKLLDDWFLSSSFMSSVHAGSIQGRWYIPISEGHGLSRDEFRARFKMLISSLDSRGLKWTEKYLAPDPFWGHKTAYWQ